MIRRPVSAEDLEFFLTNQKAQFVLTPAVRSMAEELQEFRVKYGAPVPKKWPVGTILSLPSFAGEESILVRVTGPGMTPTSFSGEIVRHPIRMVGEVESRWDATVDWTVIP